MTEIPSRFFIPMKPCGCGVLLGEECDCAAFAAEAAELAQRPIFMRTTARPGADSAPSTSYPKPQILRNIGGRLRRVEDPK
ncbi:MAG: hypothetical protein ABW000_07165 [Actinoplanes sp.]